MSLAEFDKLNIGKKINASNIIDLQGVTMISLNSANPVCRSGYLIAKVGEGRALANLMVPAKFKKWKKEAKGWHEGVGVFEIAGKASLMSPDAFIFLKKMYEPWINV